MHDERATQRNGVSALTGLVDPLGEEHISRNEVAAHDRRAAQAVERVRRPVVILARPEPVSRPLQELVGVRIAQEQSSPPSEEGGERRQVLVADRAGDLVDAVQQLHVVIQITDQPRDLGGRQHRPRARRGVAAVERDHLVEAAQNFGTVNP